MSRWEWWRENISRCEKLAFYKSRFVIGWLAITMGKRAATALWFYAVRWIEWLGRFHLHIVFCFLFWLKIVANSEMEEATQKQSTYNALIELAADARNFVLLRVSPTPHPPPPFPLIILYWRECKLGTFLSVPWDIMNENMNEN